MAEKVRFFQCPYCPCYFCSRSDLDLHLKAFGDSPHLDLFKCISKLFEADCFDAGVDEHSDWHWSVKRRVRRDVVASYLDLVRERAPWYFEE